MATVIDIINAKIPKDKFTDIEIKMAMEEAEYQIRNYCNLTKPRFNIPVQLNYVWANMAVDALFEADKMRNPGAASGGVIGSVKMGDTNFTFVDFKNSVIRSLDAQVVSYSSQLNRFRRMFWNDGEEYEEEEVYDNGSGKSI